MHSTNRNLFFGFWLRFFGATTSYLIFFLLAKILDKEEFGNFNILSTWVNLLIIFGGFGLNEILKFEFRTAKYQDSLVYSYVFSFGVISCFIISIMGLISIFIFNEFSVTIWLAIPIIYFLNFSSEIYYARCLSQGESERGVIFYNIQRQLIFLISIILLHYMEELSINFIILMYMASYLSNLVYILLDDKPTFKFRYIRKFFNLNWTHGLNNVLVFGASTIILSLDTLLLSYYNSASAVADYNFALKLVQLPTFLLLAINPKITSWIVSESIYLTSIESKNFLRKYSTLAALFCLFVGIFIISFWDVILSIFGANYSNTLIIFCILFGYKIFECYFSFYGTYINICGHSLWTIKCSIFIIVINLILNLILIPKIDAIGAAIATSISMSLFYILVYYKFTVSLNDSD